jgi:antitoxin YefM
MTELGHYIPVSKAKNRLLALIRELEQHQEAIALTRDGVPAAVLLSMEHFRGLVETIEILADPKAMRSLRRSLKQVERGEWLSDSEVFAKESS